MKPKKTDYKPLKVRFAAVNVDSADRLVIGRDALVKTIWDQLSTSSLRILAERRMGKTWVMKLALARCPENFKAQFLDLQAATTASEFVMQLNKACHQSGLVTDNWWSRVGDWFRRILQRVQGQAVGSLSLPVVDSWSSLLQDTCRHMVDTNPGKTILLIFDELPFFLDKLLKAGQDEDAIQVLDVLRSIRQEIPALRMVYCGSLGLHIVLSNLRERKYAGKPVNDMPPFEVHPLEMDCATYLSGCLLSGEYVECASVEKLAHAVADASCGVPFYIQHIVSWMVKNPGETWSPEKAASIPQALFQANGDPAEFMYYDQRLEEYYPEDCVEKARGALDVLSAAEKGLSFEQVVNLMRHRPSLSTLDPENALRVLNTLRDDFYLVNAGDLWRFKLPIVRDWWYRSRGRLPL